MRSQVNSRAVKSAYLTTCKDPISDLPSTELYNPSTSSIKSFSPDNDFKEIRRSCEDAFDRKPASYCCVAGARWFGKVCEVEYAR